MQPLEALNGLDAYRQRLADAGFWEPYVRAACERSLRAGCRLVRSGLVGTYPTFVVDECRVVKFFGRQFEGALAFETEVQAAHLLALDPAIPAPPIIGSGVLFPGARDWSWPYLIYAYVPGVSIGEVYHRVCLGDRIALARELGTITGRLHTLPVEGATLWPVSWERYTALLQAQRPDCRARQAAWYSMPEHLLAQIDSFLLPVEDLLDTSRAPHMIHSDITGDHLLGRLDGDRWTTLGLIDFGDAMIGDLLYEIVAIHVDMFRYDKGMLRAFLDGYGLDARRRDRFPVKALTVALLHLFSTLGDRVFIPFPRAREVATLDELAALLWDVDAPGPGG
jgi:Ser/Thr protein kinase RdoA (MazF antagonist)